MARPWPKKSAWPYVAKSGRKSYTVDFYDHDKVERSRTFPSVRHARAWMDDYITAERRGRDSLRRFLLDLDSREANETEARSIGEVLELYLAVNAHPRNEGGLAPSSYERYEWTIGRHLLDRPRRRPQGGTLAPPRYAVAVASVPAARFNTPQAPRAWREDMLLGGVSKPTRDQAWSVLSAALSWAASSHLVPEIQTNGCGLANEPRVNRRALDASWRYRLRPRATPSWAGGSEMGALTTGRGGDPLPDAPAGNARREILTQRDAMVVSLQYGLGARNQEVGGLRWASLAGEFAWVMEVLSCGQLTEWGKTEHSTQRRTALPDALCEDLAEWRAALQHAGHPARELDFIIPGDLNGPGHGALDSRTGACHFSENQARSWGARFFTPAVQKVAQRPEFFPILGATPYSLRRGGISLRLRAEDPQTVASECGTSLKMLSDHYAFAIEDLRRHGPRPADVEWRAARTAQADHNSREQALLSAAEHGGMRRRRKLFAWFSERRQAYRAS